ncbi:MAG TPA: helix-turn-helix transcriptional regulator [Acidimicrobiales bacterium]|nr:helix-turn-helix transcriptional regulator [Acidimicrobiales bacterium]
MPKQAVGTLVRDWRARRHRSQLDLALEVGVSARHLSFVETGRSTPSPELVLALAEGLDVPLRERNTLLLAAGYAPRYQETSLDDPAMAMMHAAIQRLLDAHDPYPGLVIDRHWNVVLTNRAATALVAGLPVDLLGPPLNVYRVCLHPAGLASRTRNFPAWASYLLHQLRRSVVLTNDPSLAALQDEVNAYPNVAALASTQGGPVWEDPPILVPVELERSGAVVSLFTTLTTFGTPRDITLDELAVELFFPADEATAELLRSS